VLAKFTTNPTGIVYHNKDVNVKHDTTVTITAKNSDFNVVNIKSTNEFFDINPKSFLLKDGESRTLTVSFTPNSLDRQQANFIIETDLCEHILYCFGFHHSSGIDQLLELTHPNGGEVFLVGSDTLINWTGTIPSDVVGLEFSNDGGNSWFDISDEASGLEHVWSKIPGPDSDECLVKVTKGSDTVSLEWYNIYPSNESSEAHSLFQNQNGQYYATGNIWNNWKSDALIMSLNDLGDPINKWEIGGSNDDYGIKIKETYDANLIFLGETSSNDILNNTYHGGRDIWVAKLDLNGQVLWQNIFGGRYEEIAKDIICTKDGGYLVVAESYSSDGDIKNAHGSSDIWILKLDPLGNLTWSSNYGGSDEDYVVGAIDSDNGYLIVGYTASNDGDINGAKGNMDVFVIKVDNSGNLQWSRNYGGTKFDEALAVFPSGYDGVSIITETSSVDGDNSSFKTGVWILNLESNGKIINDFITDKTYNSEPNLIYRTRDLGYLFIYDLGTWKGEFGIIKVDNKGKFMWDKSFNFDSGETIYGVTQTLDGGFTFCGRIDKSESSEISACYVMRLAGEGAGQSDESDATFSIVSPQAEARDIDMGESLVGEMKDMLVSDFVRSQGTYPCRIDSIKIATLDETSFDALSNLPVKVDGSGYSYHPVKFRFEPTKEGPLNSKIYVYTQAGTLEYSITGVGVEKKLDVDSDILDFGTLEIAEIKDTNKVLLKNISNESIDITNTEIIGPDMDQFEIVEGGGSFTLQAGEQRDLKLRFSPKYAGRTSSQIAFYYNDFGSPQVAQLFGAGIGGSVQVSSDSAYAGQKKMFTLFFGGVKLEKFAELVDSYTGILRVEKSILAPTDLQKIYKITADSIYIEISGTIDPTGGVIAEIEMMAALGRVPYTSIDLEEIKWYYQGQEIVYDTETGSGMFHLLGICEHGGERLIDAGSEIMMNIMPNPTGEKLKVLLTLIEEGDSEMIITDLNGGEVLRKTIRGRKENHEEVIDLSDWQQGAYFLKLKTPTRQIDKSFVKVR
jgi:hypothetical protein